MNFSGVWSYLQRALSPFALLCVCHFMTLMASAESCGKPFSMPVTNVALANGTSMRGVQVGLGSSEQLLAMIPSFRTNNTYIYDNQGQCPEGWTQAQGSTYRGGFFTPSDSTSYEAASSISAAGVDVSDTYVNATSDIWGTDMFHFASNVSSKMAFGIRRFGDDPDLTQHILGVGSNSTLLNTLKEAGTIASRSWSMYWGDSGAPETQSDGTFVLGGYDSTKVTGKNYTFPLTYNSSCITGMVVTITGFLLTFPNGTEGDLLKHGAYLSYSVEGCIVPEYPVLLTLPRNPFWENLQLAANVSDVPEQHSIGLNFWGETFPSKYQLDFGMIISLQSEFSIPVANSQVVQPDATIGEDGSINYNSTLNEMNIIPLDVGNTDDLMMQLGRQFLGGAYLMVNEDASTFTLWEATDSSDENLVAVDEQGHVFSPTCSSTTSNNTATSPSGSTGASSTSNNTTISPSGSTGLASPSTRASKTSISTIVGPVVGGVAGVMLLVGLGVFLWKLSRKDKVKAIGVPGSGTYVHGAAERTNSTPELWGNPVNEMSGQHSPKEMSGQHSPKEKSSSPIAVTSGLHELGDSY